MAHCSEPRDDGAMAEFLKDLRSEHRKPTPRQFPEGRIDPTDDGLCSMAVSVVKGKVVIAFDRPMDWVGMTPQQASDLSDSITTNALKARGIS